MVMFWKCVYVPYIILIASPSVYGSCETLCTYDVWMDWTCKCNNSTQKRIRNMCCPRGPTTREECASFCNLTLYWQEEAPCTKCNNGGVFDHHLGRCKCPPTFTGTFCCDPVHCNDNPCKHGTCNGTVSPFFCKCKPGYTGIVCNQEIEYTPAWFPYLEYSIISLVGILLLAVIACVSFKVVRAYGRSKKKKQKDVKYQNKHGATNGRRSSKKNSIMPKSMDF